MKTKLLELIIAYSDEKLKDLNHKTEDELWEILDKLLLTLYKKSHNESV